MIRNSFQFLPCFAVLLCGCARDVHEDEACAAPSETLPVAKHSLLQTTRHRIDHSAKLNSGFRGNTTADMRGIHVTKGGLLGIHVKRTRQRTRSTTAPSDIGNWEPITEDGYKNVAATGCHLEMEKFMRRVVDSVELEVCNEAGLHSLLPLYSIGENDTGISGKDLTKLTKQLQEMGQPAYCPYIAPRGACPIAQPECQQNPGTSSEGRRRCAARFQQTDVPALPECPLPAGAIWCKMHLKNGQELSMAVYDWDDSEDWVSYHICQTGFWEVDDMTEFGSAGHMLDIGANLGYYTFAFAEAGWNVTAFEPMVANVALMNATLCRNPQLAERIKIHRYGLGSKNQECSVKVAPNNVGDGHVICDESDLSFLPADFAHEFIEKGSFSVRRLDEVLEELDVKKVDLVKMDVEGYEVQVFKGAPNFFTRYQPRLIKAEAWGNMIGADGVELISIFDSAGYSYFRDNRCQVPFDARQEVSSGFAEVVACSQEALNLVQPTAVQPIAVQPVAVITTSTTTVTATTSTTFTTATTTASTTSPEKCGSPLSCTSTYSIAIALILHAMLR